MLPSNHKNQESSIIWLIKIMAGLLIIVFLAIHFLVNHLLAPNGLLTYNEVITYFKNPIIPIMEITFLIVVVAHSFIGIRSILLDLHPSPRIILWINRILALFGLSAIIYGIWLAVMIATV